ncbi:MAG: hypothetical protein JNL98_31645, partial [Bryobacterales bacterium]|nr:hypothetical protein [Bryobacterales bacterium]
MLDPATTFTLQITNSTVASAVVTLNGAQILGPNDFRPVIPTITRSVSLRATNQITVEIRGAPGERFTLQITGTDDVPPSLSITSPPDRSTVATPTVTLQGTVSDRTSGVASVACNGVAATVTGTNFTCVVPLTPGSNLITVRATDRAANTATA